MGRLPGVVMKFVARLGHFVRRSVQNGKQSPFYVRWARMALTAWFFVAVYSYLSLYHDESIKNYLSSVKETLRLHSTTQTSAIEPKELYQKLRYDTKFEFLEPYTLEDNLLTVQTGPLRGQRLESVDELAFYDADPRLIWSVYTDHWMDGTQVDTTELTQFSWYDWADFHDWNKLASLSSTKISCDFLFEPFFNKEILDQIESEIGEELFRYGRGDYNSASFTHQKDQMVFENLEVYCKADGSNEGNTTSSNRKFSSGFQVMEMFEEVRPEVYQFLGRHFMLSTLRNPTSLTILNGRNAPIQVYVNQSSRANIAQSGLLNKFVGKHRKDDQTKMFNHTAYFKKFLASSFAQKNQVTINELSDEERNAYSKQIFHLQPSDFEFDAIAKIKELRARKDSLSFHETTYLESLEFSTSNHYAFDTKYFNEPSALKDFASLGAHHDHRFFNGAIVKDPYDSQLKLNALIRTFQKFLKSNGLISWLAHGTLYGYVYNGQTFPWDFDFDVQMPIRHLHILAQHFNQTLVVEDPSEGTGRYLIDIGSSITTRINGNGKNNIDARLVCVDTGLYIDITALSVSSAMISSKFSDVFENDKKTLGAEIVHRDPNLIANETDLSLQLLQVRIDNDPSYSNEDKKLVKTMVDRSNADYRKSTSPEKLYSAEQRYSFNYDLQIYNCRNNHFMKFDEISPLVLTEFHGVSAFVPNRYITILRREYRVPLKYGFIGYKGNVFMPEFRYWCVSSLLQTLANKKQEHIDWNIIDSSLNNLKMDDIRKMYENLAQSGDSKVLSTLYNSRKLSTYRLKEIDIQFGSNSTSEKLNLLTNLHNNLSSHIQPTFKDPYLYSTERRAWERLEKEESNLTSLAREIDREIAEKLQNWTESLHDKTLDFYRLASVDFNTECEPIYVAGESSRNAVFSQDPLLVE